MAIPTRNFSLKEFECRHCHHQEIAQSLIELCQKIRDYVNIPIRINSGWRCKYYNQVCGGVFNSYHVQGLAADLSCDMGALALYDAIKEMYSCGLIPELSFCYLYTAKNFVHVDVGRKRSNGIFQRHD